MKFAWASNNRIDKHSCSWKSIDKNSIQIVTIYWYKHQNIYNNNKHRDFNNNETTDITMELA